VAQGGVRDSLAVVLLRAKNYFGTLPLTIPVIVFLARSEKLRALLPADPPPDTLTVFTCGDVAFAPTFTVTVMGG